MCDYQWNTCPDDDGWINHLIIIILIIIYPLFESKMALHMAATVLSSSVFLSFSCFFVYQSFWGCGKWSGRAHSEDMCIPTRTHLTYNNEKPWFTAKLRQLRQAKEDAYKKGDKVLYKQLYIPYFVYLYIIIFIIWQ